MLIIILHFEGLGQPRFTFRLIPNICYLHCQLSRSKNVSVACCFKSQNSASIKLKASLLSLDKTVSYSAFDLQKIKLACFFYLLD